MLRKILPLLFCFLGFQAFSQNNVKLYGFVRESHAGTVPRGTQENGNQIPSSQVATEYLVYISGPSGTRLYPAEIWIKGQRYDVRTGKVTAPVSIDQNGEKKVLVAPGTGNLMRLYPEKAGTRKISIDTRSSAAANEVVVIYKWKGKFYTAKLKKLTKLEPVFNE